MFSLFAATPTKPKVDEQEQQKSFDVLSVPEVSGSEDDFEMLNAAAEDDDEVRTAIDADEPPPADFDSEDDEGIMVISKHGQLEGEDETQFESDLSVSSDEHKEEEKAVDTPAVPAQVKKEEPTVDVKLEPQQSAAPIESLASRLQRAEAERKASEQAALVERAADARDAAYREYLVELEEWKNRMVARRAQRKAADESADRTRSKVLNVLGGIFGLLLFVGFAYVNATEKRVFEATGAAQQLEEKIAVLQMEVAEYKQRGNAATKRAVDLEQEINDLGQKLNDYNLGAWERQYAIAQKIADLQHELDDCKLNCQKPTVVPEPVVPKPIVSDAVVPELMREAVEKPLEEAARETARGPAVGPAGVGVAGVGKSIRKTVEKTIQRAKRGLIFGKCVDVRFKAVSRWTQRFGLQLPTEFKLCV
ncbi:hypothetical protein M3Y99_00438200 [Aphelenchoides fujianensis]|nr:hypothetical protein M3Y99_00438200 [Aphelenchoides fujianensis]